VAEEKRKEMELTIKRTEIEIPIEIGKSRTQYAITFWSETLAPQTIFMWKDEWTPEKEKEEILKRIKEIMSAKTEKMKISL